MICSPSIYIKRTEGSLIYIQTKLYNENALLSICPLPFINGNSVCQSTLTPLLIVSLPHSLSVINQQKNSRINPPDKSISSQETHCPSQQPIHRTSKKTIAKEQKTRDESCYVQLGDVVPDAVSEYPGCAASASNETLPPPLIVLPGC